MPVVDKVSGNWTGNSRDLGPVASAIDLLWDPQKDSLLHYFSVSPSFLSVGRSGLTLQSALNCTGENSCRRADLVLLMIYLEDTKDLLRTLLWGPQTTGPSLQWDGYSTELQAIQKGDYCRQRSSLSLRHVRSSFPHPPVTTAQPFHSLLLSSLPVTCLEACTFACVRTRDCPGQQQLQLPGLKHKYCTLNPVGRKEREEGVMSRQIYC